jgi:hypothetical protein
VPAQPAWFHRLDRILEQLRALPASYLDRQAVEKLFSVGERRARQLMAGLPCLQIGNATAIEREALLAKLEGVLQTDGFEREHRRRERIAAILENTRRQLKARNVALPAVSEAVQARNLSPGIELETGTLRIRFENAKDLATKLFELSQAMMNDWESFERDIG